MRQLKITVSITSRESISLDKYLSDICREPMISVEEEIFLAQRIREGDDRALEKLVKANLRFVVSVAKQYQVGTMTLTDLISEGNLGLIKAAQRFDETRGFKFISYAVWWIRQSIIQSITEHSRMVRLPLNQVTYVNKMRRAFADLEQKNEREPTVEELAEAMDYSLERIATSMQNSSFHVSLDAPLPGSDDFSLGDSIAQGANADTDQSLLNESLQIDVRHALKILSPMEQDILNRSFGMVYGEEQSLSAIAQHYDLTSERIRQIRSRALNKLRSRMNREIQND